MRELEGKAALVTGAGRGIGKQIAFALASQGAFVIINYNGSRQRAEETLKEITDAGGSGVTAGCDVSDFAACGEMIQNLIREYGKIDILVNNAGITRDNLLMRDRKSVV